MYSIPSGGPNSSKGSSVVVEDTVVVHKLLVAVVTAFGNDSLTTLVRFGRIVVLADVLAVCKLSVMVLKVSL